MYSSSSAFTTHSALSFLRANRWLWHQHSAFVWRLCLKLAPVSYRDPRRLRRGRTAGRLMRSCQSRMACLPRMSPPRRRALMSLRSCQRAGRQWPEMQQAPDQHMRLQVGSAPGAHVHFAQVNRKAHTLQRKCVPIMTHDRITCVRRSTSRHCQSWSRCILGCICAR